MRNFSWTRICTYADCPMKYKLRYLEKLEPLRKSPALALGYCMSCGLQEFRQKGSKDAAIRGFTDAWEKDGRILLVKKDEDPRRSVERGLEILTKYIETYVGEPKVTVEPEIEFNVNIMPDINFIGRLDAIVALDDGSYAVLEDKTTSRLGDSYFVRLRNSSQILWYLWVANKMGLFDIKNKSPKCLINAIYIHHKTLRFERDITIKANRVLDLAHENMCNWIRQIIQAEEMDLFPMNDVDNSQCTKYGGCEFISLKYLSGSLRDRIVKNEFKVRSNR